MGEGFPFPQHRADVQTDVMALLELICKNGTKDQHFKLIGEVGLAQEQERAYTRKDFIDMMRRIFATTISRDDLDNLRYLSTAENELGAGRWRLGDVQVSSAGTSRCGPAREDDLD